MITDISHGIINGIIYSARIESGVKDLIIPNKVRSGWYNKLWNRDIKEWKIRGDTTLENLLECRTNDLKDEIVYYLTANDVFSGDSEYEKYVKIMDENYIF
jgi:hypothetical protein